MHTITEVASVPEQRLSNLVSIYCSGSIMKGAGDERKLCWSDLERAGVQEGARSHEVVFLNPDDPITDPTNTLGQFGRDMYQVLIADAVVVDARERRGLGIGVEIAVANAVQTAVIVVAPRNSKYRQDVLEYRGVTIADYVHPHVAVLADALVEDFIDAGRALVGLPPKDRSKVDVPPWLAPAIDEYRLKVLPSDRPMVAAVERLGLSR